MMHDDFDIDIADGAAKNVIRKPGVSIQSMVMGGDWFCCLDGPAAEAINRHPKT